MSVNVPDDHFEAALCGLSMFITDRRRHASMGIPPEVLAAHRFMSTMSACSSAHGTQTSSEIEELNEDDLIGAEEAAALLGCSARYVRQISTTLDGAQPSGRDHVFRRRSVIEYAQRKAG